MERVARNVSIRFRKDITRSFIDYHVRLAIEDRTIHGHVLNISGGTQTYEPKFGASKTIRWSSRIGPTVRLATM